MSSIPEATTTIDNGDMDASIIYDIAWFITRPLYSPMQIPTLCMASLHQAWGKLVGAWLCSFAVVECVTAHTPHTSLAYQYLMLLGLDQPKFWQV